MLDAFRKPIFYIVTFYVLFPALLFFICIYCGGPTSVSNLWDIPWWNIINFRFFILWSHPFEQELPVICFGVVTVIRWNYFSHQKQHVHITCYPTVRSCTWTAKVDPTIRVALSQINIHTLLYVLEIRNILVKGQGKKRSFIWLNLMCM